MILAYASPWAGDISATPVYLVCGDKAVPIITEQTINQFKRVGVPMVPFTVQALEFLKDKLDPAAEHPLSFDATPPIVYTGGWYYDERYLALAYRAGPFTGPYPNTVETHPLPAPDLAIMPPECYELRYVLATPAVFDGADGRMVISLTARPGNPLYPDGASYPGSMTWQGPGGHWTDPMDPATELFLLYNDQDYSGASMANPSVPGSALVPAGWV